MAWSIGLRWAVLWIGLVAVAPAQAGSPVVVPSFVDPARHIDKPDLTTLQGLRFLTSDDDPPFDFQALDGMLAGFNVDLARAICHVLQLTCTIQARPFESLLPALDAKAGDAVIASLAMTEATRRRADFSLPTMTTPARFVARAGTGFDTIEPGTIGTATIGVQRNTAHEAYLSAFFPKAAVRSFADAAALRTALKSGAVDLIFADGLATALWLGGVEAGHCCRFVGGPFTESRYFGDGTGIAVRKGDLLLRQALDYALERLAADGTTGDLMLKYFPIGFY